MNILHSGIDHGDGPGFLTKGAILYIPGESTMRRSEISGW